MYEWLRRIARIGWPWLSDGSMGHDPRMKSRVHPKYKTKIMGVGSLGHLPIHAPTLLPGLMLKGSLFDDLIEQRINAFGAREFESGQCVELR